MPKPVTPGHNGWQAAAFLALSGALLAVFAAGEPHRGEAVAEPVHVEIAKHAGIDGRVRVVVTVENTGAAVLESVNIDAAIPETLLMVGPAAVATSWRCIESLAPTDTSCEVGSPSGPFEYGPLGWAGQTARIDDELMVVTDVTGSTFHFTRAEGDSQPASHSAGTTIYLMRPRVAIDGVVAVPGSRDYSCAVGIPRRVPCPVAGLGPGSTFAVTFDLAVRSTTIIQIDVSTAPGGSGKYPVIVARQVQRLIVPGLRRDP